MITANDIKNEIISASNLSEETKRAMAIATAEWDGTVHWGDLDQYMSKFGMDEDGAEILLEDVTDELVSSEVCIDVAGSLCIREMMEEAEEARAEAEREQEQYHNDVRAAWNAAKGIR